MNSILGPSEQQVAAMREAVLGRLPAPHVARRHRRIVAGGVIGFAALGSLAAAALVAPATPDQRNVSVDCYTSANLSAAHTTTTMVDGERDRISLDPITTRIQSALALCEADRSAVPTDPKLTNTPVEVPNPTVCQLDDLRLAVLPNGKNLAAAAFCTQLGLTVPAS